MNSFHALAWLPANIRSDVHAGLISASAYSVTSELAWVMTSANRRCIEAHSLRRRYSSGSLW